MKALTFHGKHVIRCETVPDPEILAPTDAIVRVRVTAICGSDLHPYHERERGLDHGTVMGHEFVGEIVETGSEVRRHRNSARVMSPFSTSCGGCFYCKLGLTSRCEAGQLYGWVENGAGLHGAQAELVRVPLADSTLLAIPEDVSDEEGLLLGDVFSTGYFCASNAGVQPGGTYVVVGCGPVGLMAVVGARELGAERLFAVDSIPDRLERARAFGASSIDYTAEDAAAIVREATGGRGADAVLEVVGSHGAERLAMDMLRPGGTLSVVGVHNEDRFSFVPAEAYDKNLTYRVGRCPARRLMETLTPVVQRHRHDLSSIISHRLGLDQGPSAYELFDKKQDGCTKVVLTPDRTP